MVDWRELTYWFSGWLLLALWTVAGLLIVVAIIGGFWGFYLLPALLFLLLPIVLATAVWTWWGGGPAFPPALKVSLVLCSFGLLVVVVLVERAHEVVYVIALLLDSIIVAQGFTQVVRRFPSRPLVVGTSRFWVSVAAVAAIAAALAILISRDLLLFRAAADGSEQWARFLLSIGADPNAEVGNSTPLLSAAQHGQEAILGEFLRAAGTDSQDRRLEASLRVAALRGYRGICERLIRNGVDVNAADSIGWTPLMNAAWGGHPEIVALLLASGADPGARDQQGRTAQAIARERGQSSVVEQLDRMR